MSEQASDSPQPSDSVPKQPPQECLPHSKCGIISFWLAVLAIVLFVLLYFIILDVLFVYAGSYSFIMPFLDALFVASMFGMPFAALILGIIGVCMSRTRKVFAVWGIIIAIAFPVLTLGGIILYRILFPCC